MRVKVYELYRGDSTEGGFGALFKGFKKWLYLYLTDGLRKGRSCKGRDHLFSPPALMLGWPNTHVVVDREVAPNLIL